MCKSGHDKYLVSPRNDNAIFTAKTHSLLECIVLVIIMHRRSCNCHLRVSSWYCRLVRHCRSLECVGYTHPVGELRHHTWIGKARWSALTAPSQLVVSTERNMLASINTDTGAIGTRLFLFVTCTCSYEILMRSLFLKYGVKN